GDVVGREGLLEELVALPRKATLCEGHGATVEPAVDDVRHPVRGAAAAGALERDLVDEGPVQVGIGRQAELFGALDRAYLSAVLAHPKRQWSAPVAGARKCPVDVVAEPLAHPPLLYVGGDPVGLGVVFHELVLVLVGLDVPAVKRVIDERRAAAPAERIGVSDG